MERLACQVGQVLELLRQGFENANGRPSQGGPSTYTHVQPTALSSLATSFDECITTVPAEPPYVHFESNIPSPPLDAAVLGPHNSLTRPAYARDRPPTYGQEAELRRQQSRTAGQETQPDDGPLGRFLYDLDSLNSVRDYT